MPFGCGGPGDERRLRGVAGEAFAGDGVAEGAGEGGHDPVDGDSAAVVAQLVGDECAQVRAGEVVEGDGAEGGDEVLFDVVAVAAMVVGLRWSSFSASQPVR
ncbi:hypothetical protein GCM10010430_56190 [Kitasatospora cystarginea]|uniref:Uncharacterized protein n=1 Tax=Kitasatospora cystarginea TaxID=58350 RepID=A0ABN3EPG0_9ACTN